MKKALKYLKLIFAIAIINGCNTPSNESKFNLKEGEKHIELTYDRVEAEMVEVFIFKTTKGKEKNFLIAYNSNDRWDEIAEKLVKGEKYDLIYKPFSNKSIVDSLVRNNIATDDYPASGDYIYYIEDSKGNVVFKNNFIAVKPSKKVENEFVNSDKTEIDKKYIDYLNDYYPNDMGSLGEVETKRIEGKTYWVTHYHGSGTRQEIYWLLKRNQLIPQFEFEYGGMNWETELSYTFKNISNDETIEGSVYGEDSENQIETLKQKFMFK